MSDPQPQLSQDSTPPTEDMTETKAAEGGEPPVTAAEENSVTITPHIPPGEKTDESPEAPPPKVEKKAHFQTDEPEGESKQGQETEKQKEPEPEKPKEVKKEETPKKKEEAPKKKEEAPKSRQEERKREVETRESKRAPPTPGTPRSDTSERRTQKEFFKLELQRLEGGLKRESSKINKPDKKPYTPYVFNTLEPYYNTYTTRFLINLPDEVVHQNISRRTAQGLTDPWQDLRMDRDLLPLMPSKPISRQVAILKKEKELRDRKKRSAQNASSSRNQGSTRLPKFPMVSMETQDLGTKQLYYSDVPALRQELKNKYSSSAKSKVDDDYKRTQQDFYRMELDKLDQVHPVNRKHMRSAYFAYLQNTPGSKKAITECVRSLHSGKV